jgi:Arc/MetJ-type ribon-helix-helix transcriptional regulator
MSQINLHIDAEFEEKLERLMRVRKFKTKSEAIRTAIDEILHRELQKNRSTDFTQWLGLAKRASANPKPNATLQGSGEQTSRKRDSIHRSHGGSCARGR